MRNDKVVGTALYMELRRAGYTSQYLMTPEIVLNGKVIPMTSRSRTVSKITPKKPWQPRPAPTQSPLDDIEAGVTDLESAAKIAVTRLSPYLEYFENLKESGWELFREPITVQMTSVDALAIANSSTPEDLLRRVINARIDAGYGESLWDLTQAPSV